MKTFGQFVLGALFGAVCCATIQNARATPADDLYRARVALESIASALQKCPR